jgi:acetyl esterase/lipase
LTLAALTPSGWPERLLLLTLSLWALLVWIPAWTHSLWFGGLVARETAHLGALLALALLLHLRIGSATGPALCAAALVVLLSWPLLQTMASPSARPDFEGWPGRGDATAPGPGKVWLQRPLPARSNVTVDSHRYRDTPVELYLDHYRATANTGRALRPWLLMIHGGAWRGGDRREYSGFNRALAAAGVDVLAVDYRLAPEWRYPQQLEDVRLALEWVRSRAAALGLDPQAGHVMGRSAGGQLALKLAYGESGEGLRLVISLYAPADMVYAGTAPFNRRVLDARAVLRDYLGSTWAEDPSRYRQASPLLGVERQRLPPTLLLHGPDDAMVAFEHTRRLSLALRAQNNPVSTVVLPWMQHGGDVVGIGPSAWFVFRAVTSAISRVSANSLPGAG